MDWFLYDNSLRLDRVKTTNLLTIPLYPNLLNWIVSNKPITQKTPLLQVYLQISLIRNKTVFKTEGQKKLAKFQVCSKNDIETLLTEFTCIYGTERRFLRSYCIHQDGLVH